MPDRLHFRDVAEAIDRMETRIRERVPAAKRSYIEPDVARAPR
jgi:hypothetical protein